MTTTEVTGQSIHITLDEVLRQIRVIVNETGPKYVYSVTGAVAGDPTCRYVHNGEISCMVGRILHNLGAPLIWFSEGPVSGLLALWKDRKRATWEPRVLELLQRVQGAQDAKYPYGSVQLVAEAYLAGLNDGGL